MKELIPLVLALTIIAGAAGFGLALVGDITEQPIIEADKANARKLIIAVLPEFDNSPDDETQWVESGDYRFFVGTKEGKPVGVAVSVTSPSGYSGNVISKLGIDIDGNIVAVESEAHLETPGLGSKITEDPFKSQFVGANVNNKTFEVAKDNPGSADKPAIVAITGATISSRAVTNSVREGLQHFLENKDKILGAVKAAPKEEAEAAPAEADAEETPAEEEKAEEGDK